MGNIKVTPNRFIKSKIIRENAFTSEQCDKIISYAQTPLNNYFVEGGLHNRFIKPYSVHLSPETHWVGEIISRHVAEVNHRFYKFNISHLDELHILEYEVNSFFDWHMDLDDIQDTLSTRKLTIILFLSDKSDYEGGELVMGINKEQSRESSNQEKGTLLMFPSFLPHCVKPVTKGIRRTLVSWVHGNSFT